MNLNLLLVLFTSLCFSLNAFCIKLAGGKVDPFWGIFFWASGAFITALLVLASQKFANWQNSMPQGLIFNVCSGVLITGGMMSYLWVFQRKVDFSFATPVINIGVVLTSVLLGYFVFHENLSMMRLAGIFCGILAILLISKG